MAHHKRGRPKDRRAGCLLCKPHKSNGLKGSNSSEAKHRNKRIALIESEQVPKPHEVEEGIHPAELRLIEYEANLHGQLP